MKRYTYLTLIVFFLLGTKIYSQKTNYSFLSIPSELKENANAVIRDNSIDVTINDIDEMVVRKREVITILNKIGNRYANIYEHYDNDTKITKLSAIILDAFGKQIKKYSKGKFLDVSAVDGGTLYSDSRLKYVDYTPIAYPYTIIFESESKSSSTGFIPRWYPIQGYLLGVEKSTFKLNNPLKINVRTKKRNFKQFSVIDNSSEFDLHYNLENQPAIKPENQTLPQANLIPHLTVGLDKFTIKKVSGEASNWEELGKWEYEKLYKDPDNISETTRAKVLSLVKGIKDPVEKAKLIYQFVQNRTRYINVSIGIGGLRPMKSEKVDKLGYGDCKGLTNYTRALLKIVGIESYFTEIYAGRVKKNMDFEFPVIHGNHVILNIPNNGKDIWLECTNQIMPFGFLGDFTDDRDVLVITPEGAIKKHTPAYLNAENLQTVKGTINLQEDGSLTSKLERISRGIQYDKKFSYETLNQQELIKFYKTKVWNYNNNLEIESVKLNNNKDSIVFKEDFNISIKNYASINNTEYLFRINVFNKESFVPKRYRNRKFPLKISRGYMDVDEYLVNIPAGYVLGVLPEEKNLSTIFGTYKVTFTKINDTSFRYKKNILIKEGIYSKEDYKAYRSFRKSIAKYDNLRIAITKKK